MVIATPGAERGHRVAREIEAGGARALFVRADVSQAADVHGLVKTTVDCWGRLDCAFNNAAAVEEPFVPTAAFTEAQFDRSLALNLKSFWLCLEQQIRQMLAQEPRGGAIDLFGQRPVRCAESGVVRGGQSGCDRVDQVRGARVRPPGCAHQCANLSLVAGAFETPMLEDEMNRVSGDKPEGRAEMARRYSEMTAAGRIGCPQEAAEAGAVAVLRCRFVGHRPLHDRGWRCDGCGAVDRFLAYRSQTP